MTLDRENDLAHRGGSDAGHVDAERVGVRERVFRYVGLFAALCADLVPVFGLVEDVGDDVRDGEAEEVLEEEDCVVDVVGGGGGVDGFGEGGVGG